MNLISTTQAAKMLGVSRQRIQQLIKTGRLVALRLPNSDYLLDREHVQFFSTAERKRTGRPRLNRAKARVNADGVLTATLAEHTTTVSEIIKTKGAK